jgi:hypothetical protein
MTKPAKFTKQEDFSRAVERAVADYDRSRNGGRWDKNELEEIARSSAIAEGLSYDGFQVDPGIVKAIRAIANTKLPKAYCAKALDDAWKEYSKYSK